MTKESLSKEVTCALSGLWESAIQIREEDHFA